MTYMEVGNAEVIRLPDFRSRVTSVLPVTREQLLKLVITSARELCLEFGLRAIIRVTDDVSRWHET